MAIGRWYNMGTLSVDKILKTSTGAAEFTLPATDGSAGQPMITDGSGQLSLGEVTAAGIAADAVGSSEIAANAVTASEMANSAYLANKNIIINGSMQVSQRGTSEASVTTSQYADAPDRWHIQLDGAGTWTVSQTTTAPNGFSNSYKFDCTTADASLAASDRLYLNQKVEGLNVQRFAKGTADAKPYAVSFWVRSSKTGTYIAGLWDQDNSRQCSQSYTISSADTWTKIEVDFPADTTGVPNYDTGQSLQLIFYLAAGSNYSSGTLSTTWEASTSANRAVGQVNVADSTSGDFYITGIQLEVGTTATVFEYKTFGQELQDCLRYYQTSSSTGGQAINLTDRAIAAASTFGSTFFYQTKMRAAPTIVLTDDAGNASKISYNGTANTAYTLTGTLTSSSAIFLNGSASGLTAQNAVTYRFHYTLDAEL